MRVFFVIFFSFLSFSIIAQSYESKEISSQPFQQTINKTGKLDFKRTVNLSFKATGYLKVLTVDEGEYFEEGDVLAALETTELSAAKNSTYATLLNAKRNVGRISELIAKELSSAQALDLAQTAVETARAAYRSAFYNLEKAQIIAPFSGVVVERHTDIGELQSPSQVALSIAALEHNWIIKVALTETEIASVSLNQTVNVFLNNIGNISGVVSKIPASADVETQLFTIEILLPNVDKKYRLIAGQLAQISFTTNTDKRVYAVPVDALVEINDQGDAVIMTLQEDGRTLPTTFSIYQLNNHFLYLNDDNVQNTITVITHGWHNVK
ncbi:efflux RND transporter periplasmic adaptor subunit [Thalassotalea piscium]